MDILFALVQVAVRFLLAQHVVWSAVTRAAGWGVEEAAAAAAETIVASRVEAWLRDRDRRAQQAQPEDTGDR
ncbi:hypothetical protein [Streptomyces sp. IBSBF 3136]|uniref:hypothetical protein n=1 Tax=Streptomyces sp. IBSBF 3136 TaxID=2903524 RepID=UPI002FDC1ACA